MKIYIVPSITHKPLKPVYGAMYGMATTRQKQMVESICLRKHLLVPDLTGCTKRQAAALIDKLLHPEK